MPWKRPRGLRRPCQMNRVFGEVQFPFQCACIRFDKLIAWLVTGGFFATVVKGSSGVLKGALG